MKRIIVRLLSCVFFVACAFGLYACGGDNGGNGGDTQKGSYIIRYYFEDTDGEFEHDASKDETGEDEIGKTISVRTPKTFEGYVFDEQNTNNRMFDIIREEGQDPEKRRDAGAGIYGFHRHEIPQCQIRFR